VTNPVTRHVSVTASALGTLQELSSGRILAGIGIGDSAVKTMGQKPVTRATLARYVADVRSLAEGLRVATPDGELHLNFGAPGLCPPMIIAASGPKMLELAGEIGDGAIVTRRAQAGPVLDAMLARLGAGRIAAGRDALPFRTCLSASFAVHPDRDPAIQAVRPHVASTLRHVHWAMSDAAREASERIARAYDIYQHMDPTAIHADLVPDAVVAEFAIAGAPTECIDQAVGLFEAGVDEITIRPYAVLGASRARTIEQFATEVMAPVRDRLRVAARPRNAAPGSGRAAPAPTAPGSQAATGGN
jgi:alkanesulfonate monooxygenase SsuD/methylene tetrahydromethanopterin reductase-like flavin-dependent oxidoreductase (luciferase family)